MDLLIKRKLPGCRKFGNLLTKEANASTLLVIEFEKMRMSQPFCSSSYTKCECLNLFAHRLTKEVNVSALFLIEFEKM